MQALMKQIESADVDLNAPNDEGDAPVHAIVRYKRKKRADLLLTLLVNGCSRVDVNRRSKFSGDTALHLAVMVCMGNCTCIIISSMLCFCTYFQWTMCINSL